MKKYLFKAVLPVSMAVCAITFGACSQDELLTPVKEQSEEGVLNNPKEIRNYLKTLPLAPMMTRAKGPITPHDGAPIPVEEENPIVETQGVLDGIPGNWVKTTRHYKIKQTPALPSRGRLGSLFGYPHAICSTPAALSLGGSLPKSTASSQFRQASNPNTQRKPLKIPVITV